MRWLALAFGAFVLGISVLASTGLRGDIARLAAGVPGGDVTGHFLLMGLLAFFVVLGFSRVRVARRRLGVLGSALIVSALVTLDELAQLLLPARRFSLVDLAASYAGIVVFTLLAWLIVARLRRFRSNSAS
jgi:VanZ family protein